MLPVILNKNDTAKTIVMHYDEINFKWYDIKLIFDKEYELFWVLINWNNRNDILEAILDKYTSDEVWIYNDIEEQGLNVPLLSLIFNEI